MSEERVVLNFVMETDGKVNLTFEGINNVFELLGLIETIKDIARRGSTVNAEEVENNDTV